jgi:hypothetical protein
MLVNPVHCQKAIIPMYVIEYGKFNSASELHRANERSPIESMLDGIETDCRLVQPAKSP